MDSPDLRRSPDRQTFSAHFNQGPQSSVVEFSNLGNDAQLVVPCPEAAPEVYPHIGAFIRHAPDAQKHALWERVGAAMERRLNDNPVWLSTAGGGVSWLHVRLDDYPKYYRYSLYRKSP